MKYARPYSIYDPNGNRISLLSTILYNAQLYRVTGINWATDRPIITIQQILNNALDPLELDISADEAVIIHDDPIHFKNTIPI